MIQIKSEELKFEKEFVGINSFDLLQNNKIIVVDEIGHSIALFDNAGKIIWNIDQNLKYPTDCCHFNNQIFITDRYNHRISVFDIDGKFIKVTENNFMEPYGITMDLNGTIYVSDFGNQKIQIIKPDNNFFEIGEPGPGPEYYNSDFFKNQAVYKKLLENQTFVHTIESMFYGGGFIVGNLEYPKGVAINDKNVVVADNSGRIQIFSRDGELINSFYNYPNCNWVFVYDNEIYFSCELSNVLYKINKNNEVLKYVETDHEIGKFAILENNQIIYISPFENKIYKTGF